MLLIRSCSRAVARIKLDNISKLSMICKMHQSSGTENVSSIYTWTKSFCTWVPDTKYMLENEWLSKLLIWNGYESCWSARSPRKHAFGLNVNTQSFFCMKICNNICNKIFLSSKYLFIILKYKFVFKIKITSFIITLISHSYYFPNIII